MEARNPGIPCSICGKPLYGGPLEHLPPEDSERCERIVMVRPAPKLRIWRIAPGALESRYGHANGWRIQRCERDWSLRGFPRGALGGTAHTSPKVWWEISPLHGKRGNVIQVERTLRVARAWCDRHVYDSETQRRLC